MFDSVERNQIKQIRHKINSWLVQNGYSLKGLKMSKRYLIYLEKKEGIVLYLWGRELECYLINYFFSDATLNRCTGSEKHIKIDDKAWGYLKNIINSFYPPVCMKCGATKVELHVDHIKPKSKYPYLMYELDNLQRLCKKCNTEKLNLDETDYRDKEFRAKFLKHIQEQVYI